MDNFKVPQNIPQDLLLISEFIDVPDEKPKKLVIKQQDDDIDSSGSESNASEDEIEADLIAVEDEDAAVVKSVPEPSDSSSESDSDSDSEQQPHADDADNLPDDDEDPVPTATSGTYFQTKHEIPEYDAVVPDLQQVGPDEVLEKVGEIINIMDRVVIVKGLSSETLNRGSDRALDSDTLLVFDDRTLLGYIYETFGPTSQPLYQVRFSAAYPIDSERIRLSREVYHVPARSRFVFVSQIKAIKGSDASNVHDEEPADEELEFSDDEAEAAFRSRLKRKRGESRARSTSSSRQTTPNPSQMRDQELEEQTVWSRNAYDEHGPYDLDYSDPSSSRPPPIPYDDPYSENYAAPENKSLRESKTGHVPQRPSNVPSDRGSGRGRGGRGFDRSEGRGRCRGRGRGRDRGFSGDRGRPSLGGEPGRNGWIGQSTEKNWGASETYETSTSRSASPTSLAIARATGRTPHNSSLESQQIPPNTGAWGYNQMSLQQQQILYQQQQQFTFGQQMYLPQVQPHINPRFASAFGVAVGPVHQQQQQQHYQINQYSQPFHGDALAPSIEPSWTDEWTVRTDERSSTGQPGESNTGQ